MRDYAGEQVDIAAFIEDMRHDGPRLSVDGSNLVNLLAELAWRRGYMKSAFEGN